MGECKSIALLFQLSKKVNAKTKTNKEPLNSFQQPSLNEKKKKKVPTDKLGTEQNVINRKSQHYSLRKATHHFKT